MNNLDLFELQIIPDFKLNDIIFREIKKPTVNFHNIKLFFDIMKVDINIKENNTNYTPLHYSAIFNNTELTEYLLKNGADINNQNKNGYTPLHIASELLCEDIIKILIEKKADVNIVNEHYENALMLYVKSGKNISTIYLFLENGTDLNLKDQYGKSILEQAITCNNKKAIDVLIKYVDVNDILSFGVTPLMQSVITVKYDIISSLLELGADTSLEINGNTAWDMADEETKRKFPNLKPNK